MARRLERAFGFPDVAPGERGRPGEIVCLRRARVERGRPLGVLERALNIAPRKQPLALHQPGPLLDRGVTNGDIQLGRRLGRATRGLEQHRQAQSRFTPERPVIQERRQNGFGRLPLPERQVVVCQRQPVPWPHVGERPQVRLGGRRTSGCDVERGKHATHR